MTLKLAEEVLMSGELAKEVIADECFWSIADNMITVSLVKKDGMVNWASVLCGHPPIDLY